ncbi:MAG: tetratricopeptide repeat protein, partial [Kofleriaceae bacterium]
LAIHEKALGADNPQLAVPIAGIAYIALDLGDCAEASRLSRDALALLDRARGPDRLRIASLGTLALCDFRAGRLREARAGYEKMLALADIKGYGTPDQRAMARAELAEVLWKQGERPRARKLAGEAAEIYGESGRDDDAAEVRTWLAAHAR